MAALGRREGMRGIMITVAINGFEHVLFALEAVFGGGEVALDEVLLFDFICGDMPRRRRPGIDAGQYHDYPAVF